MYMEDGLGLFPMEASKSLDDFGLTFEYTRPLFVKYEQNCSVVSLWSFITKVSEIPDLSWTHPVMLLRTCHVFRILLLYLFNRFSSKRFFEMSFEIVVFVAVVQIFDILFA